MIRRLIPLALAWAVFSLAGAQEGDVTFRSDVALVRVDAQVLDRDGRAVTGLRAADFVLLENGKPQQIRNFASEEMPVDVVLLLDVSGSMRPHVERIANAADQALRVLGDNDRIAIMVFDRATRTRVAFRSSTEGIERDLENLLQQEHFDGGTDIHRGIIDAANYLARSGRREARHAIVILTDDQTETSRAVAEMRVTRALQDAKAVLSALIAPDAMANRQGGGLGGHYPQGGRGGGGGGWPGSGGGGGGLGGIIFGQPRGGYGGRGNGGSIYGGGRTQSAGTSELARASGGDSLRVDEASALETTLARIRQRYALYFYLPDSSQSGEARSVQVQLADNTRRRYPDADVRYRQVNSSSTDAPEVSSAPPVFAPVDQPSVERRPGVRRRRPAVDEDSNGPLVVRTPPDVGTSTIPDRPATVDQPDRPAAPAGVSPVPSRGGWRRVKPGEQP